MEIASKKDGSQSESVATKWLLSKLLFTNRLARMTSWEGTKGKKLVFSSSKLCEVVLCEYEIASDAIVYFQWNSASIYLIVTHSSSSSFFSRRS